MDLASPVSAAASARSGAIARASIRVAGFAILGLAFVYLGWFLQEHWTALTRFQWSRVRWPLLPVAAVLYGSSLVTTALAWPAILEALGRKIGTRQALAIGLTAQVGKYVPGNVAHYVGRAALAKRAAVSFRQSGLSTAIEFSSAVIAGLLVAGASLIGSRALGLKLVGQIDGSQLTAVIAVMLALVTALIIAATRTPGLAFMLSQWSRPVRWLIASFLLAGSSMVVLLFALGATPGISPLLPVGFYALAWIAGFVVPGAPAGLGVREAVLIGTLSALVGNPMAIIAAAAHRLLSAIVDGIAALAGFALLTRVPVADRTEA